MCIIAVKPKNVAMPTSDVLIRMFNRNPDGAGVAYTTGKCIKIIKGIMDIGEFLKVCGKIPVEATAVIHTRISTSGGISKELCHPYELTNDFKKLRKLKNDITSGFAVAHNGIFSEFGNVANMNDTMQFISTYLQPLKQLKDKVGGSVLDEDIEPIINNLSRGSRLVILGVDGTYKRYGNGWEESKGIYYSNTGYRDYWYYQLLNNDYSTNDGCYYISDRDYYDDLDEACEEYWDWWEKQQNKKRAEAKLIHSENEPVVSADNIVKEDVVEKTKGE